MTISDADLQAILQRLDAVEARLAALEGGPAATPAIAIDGVTVGGAGAPSPEVRALLQTPGKEIHAIKLYREQTGVSLAEAKDALAPYRF